MRLNFPKPVFPGIVLLLLLGACSSAAPEDTVRTVLDGAQSRSFSKVASHLSGPLLSMYLAGWNNPAFRERFNGMIVPGKDLEPRFIRAVYAQGGRSVRVAFFLMNSRGQVAASRNWTLIRSSREGGGWRVSSIR